MKHCLLKLSILMFVCAGINGLIVPEELPTILSLIYSNIPPIRKGTDSRVGVGFRLGQHADFQVLLEIGPQIETEKLGNSGSKRRRQAMLDAALRGEMGPWSKSIAKFNLAKMKNKNDIRVESTNGEKDPPKNWLVEWSNGIAKSSGDEMPLGSSKIQRIRMNVHTNKT